MPVESKPVFMWLYPLLIRKKMFSRLADNVVATDSLILETSSNYFIHLSSHTVHYSIVSSKFIDFTHH